MKLSRFIFLVFMITATTFLYTHQNIEATKLSYEINKRKPILNKLLDQRKELEYNVAKLKAPTYLELQLAKEDVKFVLPERWQVFEATGSKEGEVDSSLPLFVRNIVDHILLRSEAQATPAAK